MEPEDSELFPYAVRRMIWSAGFTCTDELAFVSDDRLAAIGLSAERIARIRVQLPYRHPVCPTCGGTGVMALPIRA